MFKGEIVSVNISKKKGTVKHPAESIILNDGGVLQDGHHGEILRQVSLLGIESIHTQASAMNREINPGEFAENITTKGVDLNTLHVYDQFISGNVILEIIQKGKDCHGKSCAIFKEAGSCIMPKEGIFCRVLQGGTLKAGNPFTIVKRVFSISLITISDRASKGIYKDESGAVLKQLTEEYFNRNNYPFKIHQHVIADDADQIRHTIQNAVQNKMDFILTTGGTGIGQKDMTPDIVKPLLDKEITGIMEMIRVKYGMKNPGALISRSVAGMINKTLIYTLPGSPKAVKEYISEIFPTIMHSVNMINGLNAHH